jgi:hypothetical protein
MLKFAEVQLSLVLTVPADVTGQAPPNSASNSRKGTAFLREVIRETPAEVIDSLSVGELPLNCRMSVSAYT